MCELEDTTWLEMMSHLHLPPAIAKIEKTEPLSFHNRILYGRTGEGVNFCGTRLGYVHTSMCADEYSDEYIYTTGQTVQPVS